MSTSYIQGDSRSFFLETLKSYSLENFKAYLLWGPQILLLRRFPNIQS